MSRAGPTDPEALRAVVDRYCSEDRPPVDAFFDSFALLATYPPPSEGVPK